MLQRVASNAFPRIPSGPSLRRSIVEGLASDSFLQPWRCTALSKSGEAGNTFQCATFAQLADALHIPMFTHACPNDGKIDGKDLMVYRSSILSCYVKGNSRVFST
jgi:hypothetical protein